MTDTTSHPADEFFFSDKELRARWKCSAMKIFRLRKSGKLKSFKVGGTGMNLTPQHRETPVMRDMAGTLGTVQAAKLNSPSATARAKTQASPVAIIAKSRSAQLRVTLTGWRGEHRIELRESTAAIPDCFFPSANGVVLDVALLPELIAALRAAQAQAVRLGLITPKIEDTANAAPADSSARHQHDRENRKD